MRITFIGAAHEVTGSCNLVIVKFPDGRTIRFVVDCGLFQEKDYEEVVSFLGDDAGLSGSAFRTGF